MAAKSRRSSKAPEPSAWTWTRISSSPTTIVALLGLIGIFSTWWLSAKNWWPADERELKSFKEEVTRNLSATKTEVITHSDKNTAKVETGLGALRTSLRQAQIEALEIQAADIRWSQRTALTSNLAGIQRQLDVPGKRNDVVLIERKAEVENRLRALDARLAQTEERIRRMKEGQ